MQSRFKLLGIAAVIAAGVLSIPSPAQAWWARGGLYGPRWVVGPPVFVAPPPVYVARPIYAPYGRVWIRPHYLWNGAFVPGHWR